jgi:hypothetical protein
MALQLVDQLRQELEEQRQFSRNQKFEKEIDDALRNPNLTNAEIDVLLDKRLSIS